MIWNDLVGDAWVRYADVHDEQAAPFGFAVLDALGDAIAGARVLDVGCGTGATTGQLVTRGAAEVLGVDLSAPMIDAARATAGAHVRFELGDVLAVTEGGFDVVFSRFGVMFFDDPVAAFAHLRALGTAAARLGFCCWGPPAENPMMTLAVLASIPVLGPPPFAGPGEPGPFSLSSPATIAEVLGAAGWTDVDIDELTLEPPHPAGDAHAVADMSLDFNPLLAQGLQREPDRREELREAVVDALLPFERDGVVHLRASALIVTATARP